jgi:uncharacterized coiled-coil protein SlyX
MMPDWNPYDQLLKHSVDIDLLEDRQAQGIKILEEMARQIAALASSVERLHEQTKILHHRLTQLEDRD